MTKWNEAIAANMKVLLYMKAENHRNLQKSFRIAGMNHIS
jgi:hypothetical protein